MKSEISPSVGSTKSTWPTWLKLCWTIVGVPVCLLWGLVLARRLTPPYGRWHDFLQEWTSVRNLFAGCPIYMDMRESVPLHLGVEYQWIVHFNAHPPAANLLTMPFVMLPYEQAYLTWSLFSLAALVAAIGVILYQADLNYSPWCALPIVLLLLTSNPLAQQVYQGQWNPVLLLLITLAWVALRSERPMLGGALLGIAAAVKLFPAFLCLYLVAQRRWRSLAAVVGAFVALNVATALVFGGQAYTSYMLDVMPRVSQFQDYWLNASLAGFFHKLFHVTSGHVIPLWQNPPLARLCVVASCLAVIAATATVVWRAETRAQRDGGFALCMIAMLLVSPIAWDHYFLLLVLPLAILWKQPWAGWGSRTTLLLLMITLGTIRPRWIWDATIVGDGELAIGEGAVASIATPLHSLTVISIPLYALLALFVVACWRLAMVAQPAAAAAAAATAGPDTQRHQLVPANSSASNPDIAGAWTNITSH